MSGPWLGLTEMTEGWDLEQLGLKDPLSRWFSTWQGEQEAWAQLGLVTGETAHGLSSFQPGGGPLMW